MWLDLELNIYITKMYGTMNIKFNSNNNNHNNTMKNKL
jgi:hypothetical protein